MPIPELSAAELMAALEMHPEPAAPQVLDVRAPARAALGHIESPVYVNAPGSRVLPLPDAAVLGLAGPALRQAAARRAHISTQPSSRSATCTSSCS